MIKRGKESQKIISYRLPFINRARFMASSLSNLVHNLAEEIHKIKCKHGHYLLYHLREICNTNCKTKFKTMMLKSNLCSYSDAYILVKGTITV